MLDFAMREHSSVMQLRCSLISAKPGRKAQPSRGVIIDRLVETGEAWLRRGGRAHSQQVIEHVVGRVTGVTGPQVAMYVEHVVARRHERWLEFAAAAHLTVIHGGHKPVADALATVDVGDVSALADEIVDRLAGAAVAHAAVGFPVSLAEIGEIADAFACGEHVDSDTVPGSCTTLNGKPVGDACGSVNTSARLARIAAIVLLQRREMPDSSQKANAVPTWMPPRPVRAAASLSGVACDPPIQNGRPRSRMPRQVR